MDYGGAGKEAISFLRTPVSLPARARLRFALALLLATFACDNSSEPNLVPAPRTSCANYGEYLHVEGTIPLPNEGRDILCVGDRAYVATWRRIQVFDIQGPDLPRHILDIDVDAVYVDLVGSNLCAVAGQRLSIIDIH